MLTRRRHMLLLIRCDATLRPVEQPLHGTEPLGLSPDGCPIQHLANRLSDTRPTTGHSVWDAVMVPSIILQDALVAAASTELQQLSRLVLETFQYEQ